MGCCSWGVAWTQKASGPHCLPLVQTGSSAHYNSRHLLSAGNGTLFSLEIYSIPTESMCMDVITPECACDLGLANQCIRFSLAL